MIDSSSLADNGASVDVVADAYTASWLRAEDRLVVRDRRGLTILQAPLQPVVSVVDESGSAESTPGRVERAVLDGRRLRIDYAQVNATARTTVLVDFGDEHIEIGAPRYADSRQRSVVRAQLFASSGAISRPAMEFTYLVQPGLAMSSALSPVVPTEIGLDITSWLGRGSMERETELFQQWALPVHYFCGVTRAAGHNEGGSTTDKQADAFCCGLAELPTADARLRLHNGAVGLMFEYRDDLWGSPPTDDDGRRVGADIVLSFGRDYRDAIRAYQSVLGDRGLAVPDPPTPERLRTLSSAQVNTWGAQCASDRAATRFDEETLVGIYDGMRTRGMRPGMFVIDDKWEGHYGTLTHDDKRFPQFERLLSRMRSDGHRLGMWAAFLRTSDPALTGLDETCLMRDRAGKPIQKHNEFEPYYLLDPTQPRVQDSLHGLIGEFVRRYDPDLVKFDFGYELPSLATSSPERPEWRGERLLDCALDVIVTALRDAKPDIAVMYYSLSPLLVRHIDQHCHDDMYLCVDEYELENNRRLFFSSVLGELGLSVYGSGGYSWDRADQLWLDSAVAGPIGVLSGFGADEADAAVTPTLAARYNGLSAITRPCAPFVLQPMSKVSVGSTYGARSRSWLRYEKGHAVAAVVRGRDGARLPHETGVAVDGTGMVSVLGTGDLASASRLGFVGFDSAAVSLRRPGVEHYDVTRHYLDDTTQVEHVHAVGGAATVRADSPDGETTWLEIRVSTADVCDE